VESCGLIGYVGSLPECEYRVAEHKNKHRAPIKPLNVPTLGLSVGGLGFLRPAPGTWGSMPPAAGLGILVLFGAEPFIMYTALGLMCLLASAACVLWGDYAEERFGLKDAPEVVADETAGVVLPLLAAVFYEGTLFVMFAQIAWAFVLFRIMDIIKPWPARQLEQLPKGWGVLVDDLFAGFYALLAFILSMVALSATGLI